jgi:hypothetical protein
MKKWTILENEQERDVKTACQIIKRMFNDLQRQKNVAMGSEDACSFTMGNKIFEGKEGMRSVTVVVQPIK